MRIGFPAAWQSAPDQEAAISDYRTGSQAARMEQAVGRAIACNSVGNPGRSVKKYYSV